jgi:hypothetical protein
VKIYDKGYKGSKKSRSRNKEGGFDFVSRMVASLSKDQIWEMMNGKSSIVQKQDLTGRALFKNSFSSRFKNVPDDKVEINTVAGVQKILTSIHDALNRSWENSKVNEVKNAKEYGGTIVQDKKTGEFTAVNEHGGGENFYSDFSGIDADKYEIIGEYHDHPYGTKEVKTYKKAWGPAFSGLGVTFDTGDLLNLGADKLFRSELKKDYVSIIESGSVSYILVVNDVEVFKAFVSGPTNFQPAQIIDDTFSRAFEGKNAPEKNTTDFAEANWKVLINALKTYKEKNAKEVGFNLYRTTDEKKVTVEKGL